MGTFTLSPVYIADDIKNLVNDLFQAGFALIESECIKRK